ncbi:MAG TPA: ABC transporter permease [Candidatus Acidoferrales bacterium]|nr:ABC transporter permease [Candidatus Acidoferrales bacterium]
MGVASDIRHTLRMLARSPTFALIAVATLALGIGANAAIFSVVNGVLLQALPYPQADLLVFLSEHTDQVPDMSISYPNLQDWERQNTVFESLGAFQPRNFVLTGAGQPEQIDGANVSAGFLPTLGVHPVLGRVFSNSEDQPGAAAVVALSYSLWERRFGGDPGVIGRALDLDGRSYNVVAVLPQSFRFVLPADIYAPLGLNADQMQNRGNHPGIYALARLRPGVPLAGARAQMTAIMARLARQYPQTNSGDTPVVTTLREAYYSQLGGLDTALWVLLAAVGFVLLIACANVANLLLARATGREREMGIRVALGAGRFRLVGQMLTESGLLAAAGGVAGLGLGLLGTSALVAMIPADLRELVNIRVDWRVLLFLLGITLATGVIFGLAPAVHASRTNVNESLKEGGRSGTPGAGRNRYRQALVIGEFALGLVLVAASALMIRSFYRLVAVNPGFHVDNVLTAQLHLPATRYTKPSQILAFLRDVLARVGASPGVKAAGVITPLALTGYGWQTSFVVEGAPAPKPGQFPNSDYHMVSPGYFAAMGPPLLRGRLFTDADGPGDPLVVIVSRGFARRFWPGQNPIGKQINLGGPASTQPWSTVVGEVGDTKQYGLDAKTKTEFYVPAAQRLIGQWTLVVRSEGDPSALTSELRQAVLAVDNQQALSEIHPMQFYIDRTVSDRRLAALLLGLFAALGLVLAAVGIYGVIAYAVSLRTHEIGIRLALGATRSEVMRMVLGAGARMALAGVAAGVLLGLGLMKLASSLLFGVKPSDPLTYALAAVVLATVALAACYVPARRAMNVDPATALRYE